MVLQCSWADAVGDKNVPYLDGLGVVWGGMRDGAGFSEPIALLDDYLQFRLTFLSFISPVRSSEAIPKRDLLSAANSPPGVLGRGEPLQS